MTVAPKSHDLLVMVSASMMKLRCWYNDITHVPSYAVLVYRIILVVLYRTVIKICLVIAL